MKILNIFSPSYKFRQSKENLEKVAWLKSLAEWNNDWGDVTRRLNYKLDSGSIVFDIGGYKGQWASDIFAKYRCKIYIFEPIKKYAKFIQNRLNFPRKIIVLPFGASVAEGLRYLYIEFQL